MLWNIKCQEIVDDNHVKHVWEEGVKTSEHPFLLAEQHFDSTCVSILKPLSRNSSVGTRSVQVKTFKKKVRCARDHLNSTSPHPKSQSVIDPNPTSGLHESESTSSLYTKRKGSPDLDFR